MSSLKTFYNRQTANYDIILSSLGQLCESNERVEQNSYKSEPIGHFLTPWFLILWLICCVFDKMSWRLCSKTINALNQNTSWMTHTCVGVSRCVVSLSWINALNALLRATTIGLLGFTMRTYLRGHGWWLWHQSSVLSDSDLYNEGRLCSELGQHWYDSLALIRLDLPKHAKTTKRVQH